MTHFVLFQFSANFEILSLNFAV